MAESAKKLKKYAFRFLLLLTFLFLYLISPFGLNQVCDSVETKLDKPFLRSVYRSATNTLNSYGYSDDAYQNYLTLFEESEEKGYADDAKHSLLMLGKIHFDQKEYNSALKIYQIWKTRYPEEKSTITKIETRTQLMLNSNEDERTDTPPEWVNDI